MGMQGLPGLAGGFPGRNRGYSSGSSNYDRRSTDSRGSRPAYNSTDDDSDDSIQDRIIEIDSDDEKEIMKNAKKTASKDRKGGRENDNAKGRSSSGGKHDPKLCRPNCRTCASAVPDIRTTPSSVPKVAGERSPRSPQSPQTLRSSAGKSWWRSPRGGDRKKSSREQNTEPKRSSRDRDRDGRNIEQRPEQRRSGDRDNRDRDRGRRNTQQRPEQRRSGNRDDRDRAQKPNSRPSPRSGASSSDEGPRSPRLSHGFGVGNGSPGFGTGFGPMGSMPGLRGPRLGGFRGPMMRGLMFGGMGAQGPRVPFGGAFAGMNPAFPSKFSDGRKRE
jgi:hypothetical protein